VPLSHPTLFRLAVFLVPAGKAPASVTPTPIAPNPMKTTTKLRLALIVAAFVAPVVSGQTSTATASTPSAPPSTKPVPVPVDTVATATQEAVVLSPFVITTDKDNGYQATSTLAGTRLATELRDVGTSISVITSQFLQDTGATDTKSLLSYVTGSEVGGLAGNFSGGSVGGPGNTSPSENLGPQTSTRLRGLAGASEARNFYNTSIPLDGYNVDRVEVNRGANAILFGTGSPAGIINSSLKKAVFKDSLSVEARYGTYEAYRGSFDLNKQIIKGELAVRLNGLLKRTQYQQNYAFENDDRIYGAITYAPKWARTKNDVLSGTVLRGNIESGNLDSRRPRVFAPQDAFTYWFEPSFPGNPVKLAWDAANSRTNSPASVIQLTQAGPIYRNAVVWFNDPTSTVPNTGSTAPNGSPITVRQGIISNLPSALYPTGTSYWAAPKLLSDLGADARVTDGNLYQNNSLTDTSVYDYRNKLLEGPNRFEYANFEASNVSLEQRFFKDRAGLELAFDKQSFISGSNNWIQNNRLILDVNSSLLDGRPNPNYGRPYVTGVWTTNYSKSDARVGRATGYYKFDTAEVLPQRWAKWLGKFTATVLQEQGKDRFKSLAGSRFASPNDWTYSNNQLVTDNNGGAVAVASYIGPSLANASTARGANIPGLTALQIPTAANGTTFQAHAQAAGSPFVITTGTIIDDGIVPNNLATGASQTGNNIRNQAGIIQYKLLQDHLVVTSGWRRDNVDSFTAASPLRGLSRNNLIVNDGTWVLPSAPTTSVSDETQSRSAVLHVPEKLVRKVPLFSSLSLRYNTSQNFRPGGTRFDSYGKALSPQSGNTKDVGFSLGLADNRVVLTATWFTTKQINTTAGGIGGLTQNIVETWRLVKNMQGLGVNPDLSQVQAPPQFLLDLYSFRYTNGTAAFTGRNDVVLTQDAVSQGAEFELFVNLTKSWRVTANVSRVQAVRSNTGSAFYDLFFVRKTNGQSLYENWTSTVATTTYLSEGLERLANRTATNANTFYAQALQDGGPTAELRKWRANLVTTYSFNKSSRLKGFTVGSGGRWQDKVAIGFPYTNVPGTTTRVPDVQKPFFGPEEFIVDSWIRYERRIFKNKINLAVQLNANNVLNDDKLIPVGTQPNGSISVYRVPAVRRYELTTKFDF
jgi:outer membrane receptor protein involved in Fe transport